MVIDHHVDFFSFTWDCLRSTWCVPLQFKNIVKSSLVLFLELLSCSQPYPLVVFCGIFYTVPHVATNQLPLERLRCAAVKRYVCMHTLCNHGQVVRCDARHMPSWGTTGRSENSQQYLLLFEWVVAVKKAKSTRFVCQYVANNGDRAVIRWISMRNDSLGSSRSPVRVYVFSV